MSQKHDQPFLRTRKRNGKHCLTDVNRDGILDWDECIHFPQKLIESGKQELGERLKSLYDEIWAKHCQTLKLPHDNTSFTKDQWVVVVETIHKTPSYAETFIPTASRIYFDSLDCNQDGTISIDEWRVYNNNRGLTDESVIRSTFDRLDTDGDRRITREEMDLSLFQFNLGDDPSEDFSFLYAIH